MDPVDPDPVDPDPVDPDPNQNNTKTIYIGKSGIFNCLHKMINTKERIDTCLLITDRDK